MALSTERLTPQMGGAPQATLLAVPLAAAVVAYAGGIAVISNGYAKPGVTGTGLVAIGRFEETVDNSAGSAGDKTVHIRQGVFQFKNSSSNDAIAQADVGEDCYIVDDETVAKSSASGTRSRAGKIVGVDSAGVWVEVRLAEIHVDGVDITGPAAADLSTKQFYFVKLDSNGKFAVAGAGEVAVGVLQNTPNADGKIARVRILGSTKIIASAAITKGAVLASDAAGKAKAAVLGKTDTSDAGAAADALIGSHVAAVAMGSAAADGDAFAAILIHAGALPTTAA
jgi:hypothetical protein